MRLVVGLFVLASVVPSCGSDTPPAAPSCAGVELIVAGSDYERSSVLCGAPGCVLGPTTTGVDFGSDPMLARSNGRVFFLARTEDTIFEVDPSCGRPKTKFSVGRLGTQDHPANPHDAAAAPDGTVVVPLYTTPRLAFVKDGQLTGWIDLSQYDPDNNPQADAIRIVDVGGAPKAFVTLERLDDNGTTNETFLRSKQPSQMLRVDVTTRKVEAVIELAGRNPFNPMAELHGALFLAEPGNFDAADDELAGIEKFDTTTSTTKLLVRESDLGGSVSEVAVTEGCGVAIVAGPQRNVNPTSLVTFDPETGRVIANVTAPVLGPTPGYDLQGLAWRGSTLYVGDRRAGGSGYPVHVFHRKGACELVDSGRTIVLPRQPVALRAAD